VVGVLQRVFKEFEWRLNQATRFGWRSSRRALACEGSWDSMHEGGDKRIGSGSRMGVLLELEIKHKHGGFNINYEKATVVWQQFGFGS
jgi:hypothetical protein